MIAGTCPNKLIFASNDEMKAKGYYGGIEMYAHASRTLDERNCLKENGDHFKKGPTGSSDHVYIRSVKINLRWCF